MNTMHTMLALPGRATTGALILALAAGACDTDSVLEVPDPDVVAVPVFADPDNLEAVRGGVLREFARALGGEQNDEAGQIVTSGTFADEFHHSGSFTSTRLPVDERDIDDTNAANEEVFFELQRARNHAEQGAELFAASDEAAGSDGHAEIVALAGFTYVLAGENYCSGVPFSTIPFQGGETVFGEPLTTEQIFGRAVDRFDASLGFGPSAALADMARVGKARALLNLGRYDEAASEVASVATDFQYQVAYSSGTQAAFNAVWNLVNAERRWSATGNEGTNGIDFFDDDPRTPTEFDGNGQNGNTAHYSQGRYTGPGSDIPLATGIEARLIEAEAALQAGDRATFFTRHNDLRATLDLPAFDDTGQSTDDLVDLHFEERARWLWLTAHRLGDMRRLLRQYGRSADQVYPIGPTEQGTARGTQVTLRVPFTETNNPNYSVSDCDPTVP